MSIKNKNIKKKNMATNDKVENADFWKSTNKSKKNVEEVEETEINESEEKVMIGIKVSPTHKKILEKHFKNYRGTTLSSGIRELIFSYMRENDLI